MFINEQSYKRIYKHTNMIEIIYIINIFNSNSCNRRLFISSEKYRKSSIRKNCKFFI